MRARHGWLRDLLVTLVAAQALSACHSPEDAGHRIFGYVDADGREVIAPQFLRARPFNGGLAAVRVAEGWGYIDTAGRWVIPPAYLDARSFDGDRAAVRDRGGTWVSIDREGRVVADAKPTVTPAAAGDEIDEPKSYWEYAILRMDEEQEAAFRAEPVSPSRTVGSTYGDADPDGEPDVESPSEEVYPFIDGRALAKEDDKYGFVDREGRFVVPPKFDEALLRFSRERSVALHDEQAWLIDAKGEDVASLGAWPWPELQGEEEWSDLVRFVGYGDFFADGLIPWQRDGRWGYIGRDGNWVISPQYEMAQPFHEGRASVQTDGHGMLIDTRGRELARVPRGWWIAPSGGSRLMVGTWNRWGFADADGKPPAVLPYATFRITFMGRSFADARPLQFNGGLAAVSRIAPHRWRVLDMDGHERAAGRYDLVQDAGEGLYAVASEQQWRLANSRLEPLSSVRMDTAPLFIDEWDKGVAVVHDGRLGCVDRRGRWRALPTSVQDADCDSSLMVATSADTEKMGVLASEGRWVVPPEYVDASALEVPGAACFRLVAVKSEDAEIGRIACIENGKARYSVPRRLRCEWLAVCFLQDSQDWRRLDFRTLQVTGPRLAAIGDYWKGQLIVRIGDRRGLMASSGKMTLPAEYDELAWLTDGGEWRSGLKARQENRWGIFAPDGRVVVPMSHDAIRRLADGMFAVRDGTLWGVVRDGGEVIVPPKFDEILDLSGELLLVRSGDVLRFETLSGQQLLDPAPPWLQRIHALSDFSDRYWGVFTRDRELYLIDKQTHAIRAVDPPPGCVWVGPGYYPQLPDELPEFRPGGFRGLLYVRMPGASGSTDGASIKAVVMDATGRLLPWIFDSGMPDFRLPANRYLVNLRGKCGIVDVHGRWLVPLGHDHCTFTNDGLVIVGDEDY